MSVPDYKEIGKNVYFKNADKYTYFIFYSLYTRLFLGTRTFIFHGSGSGSYDEDRLIN